MNFEINQEKKDLFFAGIGVGATLIGIVGVTIMPANLLALFSLLVGAMLIGVVIYPKINKGVKKK